MIILIWIKFYETDWDCVLNRFLICVNIFCYHFESHAQAIHSKEIPYFVIAQKAHTPMSLWISVTRWQDFLFNIWPFTITKNYTIAKVFAKSGSNFRQTLNTLWKNYKRLFKFVILPNMVTLLLTSFPSCQSGVNCVTQHPFCWDEKQVFNSNDLAYWGKSNRAGVLLKCSPISEDNFFRKVQLEIWDDESWWRFCFCFCWWCSCSIILDGSKVLKVARRRCSSGKWETLVVQIIRLTKTISGSIERNSITTNIFLSLYNFFFLSLSLQLLLSFLLSLYSFTFILCVHLKSLFLLLHLHYASSTSLHHISLFLCFINAMTCHENLLILCLSF